MDFNFYDSLIIINSVIYVYFERKNNYKVEKVSRRRRVHYGLISKVRTNRIDDYFMNVVNNAINVANIDRIKRKRLENANVKKNFTSIYGKDRK